LSSQRAELWQKYSAHNKREIWLPAFAEKSMDETNQKRTNHQYLDTRPKQAPPFLSRELIDALWLWEALVESKVIEESVFLLPDLVEPLGNTT